MTFDEGSVTSLLNNHRLMESVLHGMALVKAGNWKELPTTIRKLGDEVGVTMELWEDGTVKTRVVWFTLDQVVDEMNAINKVAV